MPHLHVVTLPFRVQVKLGLDGATGVTGRHGLGLTPIPGPDEAIITVSADDGARASAIISKKLLPPLLLAGLEDAQAANRAVQAEYRTRRDSQT